LFSAGIVRMKRLRSRFMRTIPAENKCVFLPFRDTKPGARGIVFSAGLHSAAQEQRVRPRDRVQPVPFAPHPRHRAPVVETHHQLHLHLDAAFHTFDDTNKIVAPIRRRHAVDEPNASAVGVELGFEDQGVATVTPARRSLSLSAAIRASPSLVPARSCYRSRIPSPAA